MTRQGPNIFPILSAGNENKIVIPCEAHIWKTSPLIESVSRQNIHKTERARRAGREKVQDPESQAPHAAVWFISLC